MFSYVTMEERIASDHPARPIRALVDGALKRMDAELSKLYARRPAGRRSRRSDCCGRFCSCVLYSIRRSGN